MKARFRLTSADYVEYNQRLCIRRTVPSVIPIVFILALIGIVDDGADGLLPVLVGTVAGLVALSLYFFVRVPRLARAIYSEQPSMSEEKALTIDDDGIRFEQESGTFQSNWSSLVQWDETPRLVTLFVNRAMMIPITKADVGQEVVEAIRLYLIRSGLPKPLRLRRRT